MATTTDPNVIRISHLIDDHERQRTKALGEVRRINDLLSNAQHALTHGSPDVTAEFIERALIYVGEAIGSLTVDLD